MPIHDCIRSLYAATVDVPPAGFAQFAMRRAGGALACTAVLWQFSEPGSGGTLQRRSAILDHDVDAAGLDSIVLERQAPPPQGVALQTCRVQIPSISPAEHHFAFARATPARFESHETDSLPQLALHMVAAENLCRQIALRLARSHPRLEVDEGSAMATVEGQVLGANARFLEQLRAVEPDWDGRKLPFGLDSAIPILSYKGLIVRVEQRADGYKLQLRKDRREPSLTDRELEIAQRVGVGLTFKEIARELALAPSTVSTHLYNLYAKLGIRRRAELVAWLSRRVR